MHILHVTDTLAIGGKERMVVDLANQAKTAGFAASVCVTREDMSLAHELNTEVKRWALHRKNRFDWLAMKRFAELVSSEEVDILHAHGRSTFSFLAFLKLLCLIKQPILLHDHYGLIETDQSVPYWFKLGGERFVKQYVGVYQKLERWALNAGIDSDKIHTIENALDLDRFKVGKKTLQRKELGIPEEATVGIGVGDMRLEKGWDLFLNAVKQIKDLKKAYFLFVGGASAPSFEAKCREIVKDSSLKERVKFLGSRDDIPQLLQMADFAFMPSVSESGPLVLIEYMVAGLPVVYSRVGDIGNRATQCELLGSVPVGDHVAIARELDKILVLSEEDRKERGQKGIEIAEKYFSIKNVMPRWVQIYRGMLDS